MFSLHDRVFVTLLKDLEIKNEKNHEFICKCDTSVDVLGENHQGKSNAFCQLFQDGCEEEEK